MYKTAFITGATSGIGLATAICFANQHYKLVLCGRNLEKLTEVSSQISTPVHLLNFDVRNFKACEAAIQSLPAAFQDIDLLINNAGNAHGLDKFQDGHLDDWENMIDTNVKGMMYVSRLIIPIMIAKKSGHIVNIISIAGKEVYPKGNVYCASKFAAQALSDSIRIDLIEHGIKVSSISPGLVETEFSNVRFKGDKVRAKKVYDGINPLTPEDIAEIIYFAASRPPHVNISDLTVLASQQATASIVNRSF